jgi:hypothetical protein
MADFQLDSRRFLLAAFAPPVAARRLGPGKDN